MQMTVMTRIQILPSFILGLFCTAAQVPGCVLGIRVGETLKQKRLDSTRTSCSFPKPDKKMRLGSRDGEAAEPAQSMCAES